MIVDDAKKEIAKFFKNYGASFDPSKLAGGKRKAYEKGKVYELYCLGRTIEYLTSIPGVTATYVRGSSVTLGDPVSLDFKASPGLIDMGKSRFVVSGNGLTLELHTDIEVMTLSSYHGNGVTGKSSYHEIDLVLVRNPQNGQRPLYNQVFLGVECKAHDPFKKPIVRQVLGARRELSFYRDLPEPSLLNYLGQSGNVKADPPSAFWLAFSDPRGLNYRSGPEEFGIEFKHWCP